MNFFDVGCRFFLVIMCLLFLTVSCQGATYLAAEGVIYLLWGRGWDWAAKVQQHQQGFEVEVFGLDM